MYKINNNNIVAVCLHSYGFDKKMTEYPFDSALITFNQKKENKYESKKNRFIIEHHNGCIEKIILFMRYDEAIQFLYKLHFQPLIDINEMCWGDIPDEITNYKEFWDNVADCSEKCVGAEADKIREEKHKREFQSFIDELSKKS